MLFRSKRLYYEKLRLIFTSANNIRRRVNLSLIGVFYLNKRYVLMIKALLSLSMLLVFMLAVVDSVIRSGESFHFLTTNKRLDSMLDYAMIEHPQV